MSLSWRFTQDRNGAPAIRTCLTAGLHYHPHDLLDEQVVKGWTENPNWQHFCSEA